ncbi:MAG: hypothetical protein IPM53_10250 [Anaerolineaceae bacterium]|nr:hypothetical protein [Anaerolineaceae bacterium]
MWSFTPARWLIGLASFVLLIFLLVACTTGGETAVSDTITPLPATFTPLPSPTTPVQPTTAVRQTPTPEASEGQVDPPNQAPEQPEEAILILEPGPGSRIAASPLRVAGVADPTFEQNLVIRLLLADGTELALVPTTIQANIGERGAFEVEVPFAVSGEQQAFVQVYATSARDGGITHLSSVGITLADSGESQIVPVEPHPERIQISQPALGATVSGGTVTVSGTALASFEQTLLVEVLDEAGEVLNAQPVTVEAPDLGQPGPFSLALSYEVSASMPGRIVVRDVSPAFGGDVHLASVEVTLEP